MTWQWERRAGIWSDVLSPARALSGRLASLQVSIGHRQGHIRETVSCERLYSRGHAAGVTSISPFEGEGGDQIRPCPERFQSFLVKLSDRDGLGARADLRTE